MRILIAVIAALALVGAVGCSAGDGSDEPASAPSTPAGSSEPVAARGEVLGVSASVAERIGAGRAVVAASSGATTVVATTAGVHLVGAGDPVALPVTTDEVATRVAVSPDGGTALIAWSDATELWALRGSPQLLHRQPGTIAAGFSAADRAVFASPSTVLVIDGDDGTVLRQDDAADGTAFRALAVDAERSSWFAVMSGDEEAGSSADTTVLIGRGDGEPTAASPDLPDRFIVEAITVGSSGHHVAITGIDRTVGADDRIVLWDADSGATTGTAPISSADVWDIGGDGSVLVAGGSDPRLIRPDGTEVAVRAEIPVTDGDFPIPTAVHGLADGRFVVVWRDGSLTVHGPTGDLVEREAGTGNTVVASTTSAGRTGLSAVDFFGAVEVFGTDGRLVREIDRFVAPQVEDIAIDGDDRLAVANAQGRVTVLGDGPPETFSHPEGTVTSVAFSPDGQRLVTGVGARVGPNAFDDTVSVWDVAGADRLQVVGGGAEEIAGCLRFENVVEYAPDGSFYVAASHDFTVYLVDTGTGEVRWIYQTQGGPTRDVAISPDGNRLAITSDDAGLRIWDIPTGELLTEHRSGIGGFFDIDWLPDGSALVGIDATGHLSTIDPASGSALTAFESIASREAPVSVSPDGRLVAAAEGSTIRLWSPDSGRLLSEIVGHTGAVTASAFVADGSALVSGGADGTVVRWDLELTGAS